MSILNDIDALVVSAPSHIGEAPTGTSMPYVVSRPLIIDDVTVAINGKGIDWDFQFSLYCCAASWEASYNLAVMVMKDLNGQWVGGTTLTTSMGYTGALVEGHYESQVTVQLNQGGI